MSCDNDFDILDHKLEPNYVGFLDFNIRYSKKTSVLCNNKISASFFYVTDVVKCIKIQYLIYFYGVH